MYFYYTARVGTIAPMAASGEIGGDTFDVYTPHGWVAGGDINWRNFDRDDDIECRVPMLGIVLDVIRGDNATNGISRDHDRVTVVGVLDDRDANRASMSHATDRVVGLSFDLVRQRATDEAPAVWLQIRRIGGQNTYGLVPASGREEPRPRYMYGGNTATSTDPHWLTYMAGRPGPVKIHDRTES